MLPTKFRVNWPFGLGEEVKNRFSRWLPWWPSWISDQNVFSYFFYLHVTPMLPTKFRVNWPFGSGKEAKYRFSRWLPPLDFSQNDLGIFDLQVTLVLPTKFRVNWPLGSGEAKNRFSRWPPWWPSWISDRNDLSYF